MGMFDSKLRKMIEENKKKKEGSMDSDSSKSKWDDVRSGFSGKSKEELAEDDKKRKKSKGMFDGLKAMLGSK